LSSRHFVFICFFFLCLTAALPAWGRKEKAEPVVIEPQVIYLDKNIAEKVEKEEAEAAIPTLVQVTGIVRLVGGGPIPEIVITGPEREWYVSREDDHLLKDLQHQTVTVEGYESVYELRFANGFYAGQRRTLSDIKILNVE